MPNFVFFKNKSKCEQPTSTRRMTIDLMPCNFKNWICTFRVIPQHCGEVKFPQFLLNSHVCPLEHWLLSTYAINGWTFLPKNPRIWQPLKTFPLQRAMENLVLPASFKPSLRRRIRQKSFFIYHENIGWNFAWHSRVLHSLRIMSQGRKLKGLQGVRTIVAFPKKIFFVLPITRREISYLLFFPK